MSSSCRIFSFYFQSDFLHGTRLMDEQEYKIAPAVALVWRGIALYGLGQTTCSLPAGLQRLMEEQDFQSVRLRGYMFVRSYIHKRRFIYRSPYEQSTPVRYSTCQFVSNYTAVFVLILPCSLRLITNLNLYSSFIFFNYARAIGTLLFYFKLNLCAD